MTPANLAELRKAWRDMGRPVITTSDGCALGAYSTMIIGTAKDMGADPGTMCTAFRVTGLTFHGSTDGELDQMHKLANQITEP